MSQPQTKAEWHTLREVMLHEPGEETFFGLFCWMECLYDGVMRFLPNEDNKGMIKQHQELVDKLRGENVTVHGLKDLVLKNPKSRKMSEEIFYRTFEKLYKMPQYAGHNSEIDTKKVVYGATPEMIWKTLTLNPQNYSCCELTKGVDARSIAPRVVLEPLGDLHFMRDQQCTTDKGIVSGRMAKPARISEPLILKLALEFLGIMPVHEVQKGTFEGGDFIPADKFALIGVGQRTSKEGALEVMENGLGFDEVLLVYQPNDMDHMHHDTYFNMISSSLCVGEMDTLQRSKVEIYNKNNGGYELTDRKTLSQYLKGRGFSIEPITKKEQKKYAPNFLTIKENRIIASDFEKVMPESDYLYRLERKYGVDVLRADVSELTQGYGGIHCMTCVLRRD